MRGDQPINDDSVCCEGAKGADLISPHEAAVALHIGGEDRRELPFERAGFQGSAPPNREYNRSRRDIRASVNHPEADGGGYPEADRLNLSSCGRDRPTGIQGSI